ncbi:MAG: alpha amylase, catalytic subdomain [Ilumatobacteraceae bacterium]|nr:alpha amylase, catalytic subdomain [Ilumatobacteraceae bacterium]
MNAPDWFRDVVIYQLHVRSFADSNGDGTGDFDGLTSRLDYLVDLGIDAIWLLPFFPSPLRDDGYDIADYESVNPAYGDMASFKRFLKAAHDRGLKVIVELVMNHTSDQHPWFQRARRAPAGSRYRDFYVWSDTTEKYDDARIIFQDFETSNWSWDPVAQSYYWHRFYHHQPDLNFDSIDVKREMFRIFDKWFKLGVDGVRLDAVPYLFEREGTDCENLPETHEFLRELRAHMDERYPGRMLLAEANQWPEDAVEYFGDGDECHMAFHFPLMPRLFLGLQMESRTPIVDILEQTPALPDGCQWALFLRNHDELTLEMVTDEERDYMYRRYAGDPRMRVNVGIRRRLSTLLQDDRRKVELLNALLLSLPGTPTIYYGDEIGMGDNVYLGDRDSVRTPMQWSGDRNAGFSPGDPQRLFLPLITDSQHHYESINVEAQRKNPSSLWWWMRRMIAMRQRNPVFARGDMTVVESDNTKVLTFLRSLPDRDGEHWDDVLVVANLSRHAQQVNIPLADYRGVSPVELAGGAVLSPIDDRDYRLTLGPHDVFWLRLANAVPAELDSLSVSTSSMSGLSVMPLRLPLDRRTTAALLAAARPYIAEQRWFGDRARTVTDTAIVDAVALHDTLWWVLVQIDFDSGEPAMYALVLSPEGADPVYAGDVARMILRGEREAGRHGALNGEPIGRAITRRLDTPESRVLGGEQSNSSNIVADQWVLKLLRRVEAGVHPEVEILQHLNSVGFPNVAPLVGTLQYVPTVIGEPTTVATLVGLVRNDGEAYTTVVDQCAHFLEWAATLSGTGVLPAAAPALLDEGAVPPELAEVLGEALALADLLGLRTAELHIALAAADTPRMRPQVFNAHAQRSFYQAMRTEAKATAAALKSAGLPAGDIERAIMQRCEPLLDHQIDGQRIRVHGDLHLGQILVRGGDVSFIDFEGEPSRPLGERSIRRTPIIDVAGLVRSFGYAADAALRSAVERGLGSIESLEPWARSFEAWCGQRLVYSYLPPIEKADILPTDIIDTGLLLDIALVQKAAYEVRYEVGHRPDLVGVPLAALRRMLAL